MAVEIMVSLMDLGLLRSALAQGGSIVIDFNSSDYARAERLSNLGLFSRGDRDLELDQAAYMVTELGERFAGSSDARRPVRGKTLAEVFSNEKSGLRPDDLNLLHRKAPETPWVNPRYAKMAYREGS